MLVRIGGIVYDVPDDDSWRYESYARKVAIYAALAKLMAREWDTTQAYLLDFD